MNLLKKKCVINCDRQKVNKHTDAAYSKFIFIILKNYLSHILVPFVLIVIMYLLFDTKNVHLCFLG